MTFRGLEIDSLTKSFEGKHAVDNVSLKIPQGEFWCFLGPSGCGKTTLLRMVAGLEAPTSGRMLMDGRDLTRTPVHERNFGMVFQSLALFPHLTVEENIAYALKVKGRDARVRRERVTELLDLIRLPDIGQRRIDQLSGGQRQRVAIARALAQEPQLFLMDEPLSALDAHMRDHMQVEIKQLQRELKITTIFVTHDQREAMTIADRIVVMSEGRVQQIGSPVDIYREPANRFVAGFIGQSNLIEGEAAGSGKVRIAGSVVDIAACSASARPQQRITLCVRPEDLLLKPARGAALVADVTFVRDLGAALEIRLNCAGMDLVAVTKRAEWAQIAGQAQVGIGFAPEGARLLPQEDTP
jgi:putative spermidine/putrescine transport system ATP-binding protein